MATKVAANRIDKIESAEIPKPPADVNGQTGIYLNLRFKRGRGGSPVCFPIISDVGEVIGLPVTAFRPGYASWYECFAYPTTGNDHVYKVMPAKWETLKPEEAPGQIVCRGSELLVVKDETQGRGKNKVRHVLLRYVPRQPEPASTPASKPANDKKVSGAYVHLREGAEPPGKDDAEREYILGTSIRSLSYVLIGPNEPISVSEEESIVLTGSRQSPLDVYMVPFLKIGENGSISRPRYEFPETILGLGRIVLKPERAVERLETDTELKARLGVKRLLKKHRDGPRETVTVRMMAQERADQIEAGKAKIRTARCQLIDKGVITPEKIKAAAGLLRRALVSAWHPDILIRRTDIRERARQRIAEAFPEALDGIEWAEQALLGFIHIHVGMGNWAAQAAAIMAAEQAAAETAAKQCKPTTASKAKVGKSPAKPRRDRALSREEMERLAEPYIACLKAASAGRVHERPSIALALFTRFRVPPQEVKNLGLTDDDVVSEMLAAGVNAGKVRRLLEHLKAI